MDGKAEEKSQTEQRKCPLTLAADGQPDELPTWLQTINRAIALANKGESEVVMAKVFLTLESMCYTNELVKHFFSK